MLRKALQKNKKGVGVAITETQFNFLVVEQDPAGINIIEEGCFRTEELDKAIHYLQTHYKDIPCHLALPNRFLVLKILEFSSYFKERDVRNLVQYNAEEYFACPAETMFFDVEFLCALRKKIRVLAGKRDYIDKWQNIFVRAGLNIKTITADILAVEKILTYYGVIESDKVYALFIVTATECLQAIIIDCHMCILANNLVIKNTLESYQEEMLTFFRRYESSKTFMQPITDIILLGCEASLFKKIHHNVSLPIIGEEKLGDIVAMHPNRLIPLGMVLSC
ncbi:MAG: hypothetical protein H0U71_02895 [Gammaproteobacteria bacterium]|nr:hypothetical protein [Gammaproteobacteria bacterium]